MDFSVLADRDCLVAFAAVVLRSDRGMEAHKMVTTTAASLTSPRRARSGETGLSQAASGRVPRRLEEAGLIISDGDRCYDAG